MLALVSSTFEFAMAADAVSNAAPSVEVMVLRGGDTAGEASVNFSTSAGTARANVDFVVAFGTLSFAHSETFKTVVVSLVDQPSAPATSTFTLGLSAPSAGSALTGFTSHEVTLQNDRSPVEIAAASYTRTTDHATASVTVTRTGNTTIPVSVAYATTNGTAQAGVHYTAASGTVDFLAGETSKVVSVSLLGNKDAGASVSFGLGISSPTGGAVLIGRTGTTVNITNAYSPVQFSSAAYAATTDDTGITITITRTGNLSMAGAVDYFTVDGSASAGTHYSDSSGAITFSAGQASRTFTVPLERNRYGADGVNFAVSLGAAYGAVVVSTTSLAVVTINNPHAPIQLDAFAYAATTVDNAVLLTVNRTGNTSVAASVDYATTPGTAVEGTDYIGGASTLAFAPGEASKQISISLLENLEAPGDRTFTLALSNPAGAAQIGTVAWSTVTIENPYSPVRFAAAGYTASTDDAEVEITVVRSGNLSVPATVDYATGDLTAIFDHDYGAAADTLSFAPGEASATFTVPLLGNRHAADGLRFAVTFAGGTGGAVLETPATTIVTIENDHVPVQLAAVEYGFTIDDPGAQLTVTRTGDVARAVTVNYATADGTAHAGTDYTAKSGIITFGPGVTTRTITVPLLSNFAGAAASDFTVTLTSPGGGAELGAADSARVEIANPYSLVRVDETTYSADVRDGSVRIDLERLGNLANTATIAYTTVDGTGTAGTDYQATNGVLTLGAGVDSGFVTVPLLGSAASPASRTFKLELSSSGGNAVIGLPFEATVTVVNLQSVVQFAQSDYEVVSTDGTAVLTLTRVGNTSVGSSVSVGTVDGTAVDGRDYDAITETVAFDPGETTATVIVPLRVNPTGPAAVAFDVGLTGNTGMVVGAPGTATVTVENPLAVVGFDSRFITVSGDDGVAHLVVRRVGNTSLPGSVSFATQSITATPGEDYGHLSGVVSFAAGEAEKAIIVALPGNAAAPAEVSFRVVITGGTGAAVVGADDTTNVIVTNSHSLVGFAPAAVSAGESSGTVTLTLTRAGNLSHAVSVDFATVDGTATAGADYTAATGTISFEPDQSTAFVSVAVNDDMVFDPQESFGVVLRDPAGGAVLGAAAAAVTISDTTPPPTFSGGGLVALQRAGRLDGLSLTFDQALEGAPPVSAFSLYHRTAERSGGAARLRPVTLAEATYDAAARAVTVRPVRPLRAGAFYQLSVNSESIRNQAGKSLDGAGNGHAGSPLLLSFGQGKSLRYVDHNGDTVQLRLRGPGVLELTRRPDGEGDALSVIGATSTTILSGTVRRTRTGGDGQTTLSSLVGLGDGTNGLTTTQFGVSLIA